MACTWILSHGLYMDTERYNSLQSSSSSPTSATCSIVSGCRDGSSCTSSVAQAKVASKGSNSRQQTHQNGRRIVHQQAGKILINNDTEGARYLIQAFGVDATAVDYSVQHVWWLPKLPGSHRMVCLLVPDFTQFTVMYTIFYILIIIENTN